MELNLILTPEARARGTAARWQPDEHRRLPYIEHCDYSKFLRLLVERHGEDYLRRPDGSLLDGVTGLPEGVAHGDDRPMERIEFTARTRVLGAKRLIREALAEKTRTVSEIAAITRLNPKTIHGTFYTDKGRMFRREGAAWRLAVGDEIGQAIEREQRPPARDKVIAFLKEHGPATTKEICQATGHSRHAAYMLCDTDPHIVKTHKVGHERYWGIKDSDVNPD